MEKSAIYRSTEHSRDSIRYLPDFGATIQTALSSTPKNVLIFLEYGVATTEQADRFAKRVGHGNLPQQAFFQTLFPGTVVSSSGSHLRQFAGEYAQLADFLDAELQLLGKFPQPIRRRLKIHIEGQDERTVTDAQTKVKDSEKQRDTVYKYTEKGQFDIALPHHERSIRLRADVMRKREDDAVQRISSLMTKDQADVAVIHFGVAHGRRISQLLTSAGIKTQLNRKEIFSTRNVYYQDPYNLLFRLLIDHPERPISTLEWLQSMLGTVIISDINVLKRAGLEGTDKNTLCRIYYGLVQRRLQTENDIRNVEDYIRSRGYERTLVDLLRSA